MYNLGATTCSSAEGLLIDVVTNISLLLKWYQCLFVRDIFIFSNELKVFEIINYISVTNCQEANAYFDLNKTDVQKTQGSHEIMSVR